MSILIADSGATKTEWCLVTSSENEVITTEGLNPYYHSPESIREVLENDLKPNLRANQLDKIYFYGAGCDSPEKDQLIERALDRSFSSAQAHVYHDLLGAARACFLDEAGIACILGTGSNSCLYDGTGIVEHIPSLAFILGDEGSAGYFGKKLINSYFRFEIPDELRSDLEENYNMSLDHITEGTYKKSQTSRFIASYASFLGDHPNHPFIQNMLREGFDNFITRIVMKYSNARDYKVSFIGSVAYYHRELISDILAENNMQVGSFIQKPMDRLVEFHTKNLAENNAD